MPPNREERQAIEFFERWFRTNIPGSARRNRYRIVVRSSDLTRPNTIGISDDEWIDNFSKTAGALSGLVASFFGGDVSLYPWYIALQGGEASVGVITPESVDEKKRACPGLWVDLRGSFHTSQIADFVEYLGLHDVPAPTVITGRDMDGTLDYFDAGRMWWRTEWDRPPVLNNGMQAVHAAWGMHIQAHAIRFGLCQGLPVNGWPTLAEALYPLPGTNGVSVLYTGGDTVPWRTVELSTDRRLSVIAALRVYYATLDPQNAAHPVLWDHVLKPQGWKYRGMGTVANEQWWTAPGGNREMTARTTNKVLRLHLPNWLSGLKEVSDAGVVLNKWTVACVLGWDGEVDAMLAHWTETRQLY